MDGVLLDFDGTISKNAVEIAVRILHDFLSERQPVPLEFVKDYFKTVTAFPLRQAIVQLFEAFGLQNEISRCFALFADVREYRGDAVVIEKDFWSFVRFCRERGLALRIFSSAGVQQSRFAPLLDVLAPEEFLSFSHRPKSNPATYSEIAQSMKVDPARWVVVDDAPLALWSAKTAGFRTVAMENDVFGETDRLVFLSWINASVGSFRDLQKVLESEEWK